MSVMHINDVWLPDDRPLTVDDLENLPDDGNRYELVDGVLEVSAAPFGPHERVVHRLHFLLELVAPLEFEIPGQQGIDMAELVRYRIPDLSVIRRGTYEPKSLTQPPLLVIEVASPGTALRDRNTKGREYEQFGIASYWIIVPDFDSPSITAYELHDGHYVETAHVTGGGIFQTDQPYPFAVTPRALVTDGDWKPPARP